jgi:hypothetical protein
MEQEFKTCIHETEFQELKKKADSHLTWVTFWSIVLLLVGIATGVINNIVKEKDNAHAALNTRVTALEAQSSESRVAYATIQTQLAQIQMDLAELKKRK